ncbi:MAG: hypothetical protein Q4D05_06210 [Acinetobacter sp.]|nr:hypothetical protein [Acinetobacter sp.]
MLTKSDVDAVLGMGWDNGKDAQRAVMIANAWLNKHGVLKLPLPLEVMQAGAEIALAFVKDEIYQGRTEGVVIQKSASAGDVSVSKQYADGVDGKAMSSHEMIALDLIAPFKTFAAVVAFDRA